MNWLKIVSLACLLFLCNALVSGQTTENVYTVATWKGFADAAITFTFDDNTNNQYTKAIPLLNEFHFNGTFYVVMDWKPDWPQFAKAAEEGHEIGSHSVSHPNMSDISDSLQELELRNSYETINKHFVNQGGLTLAYPFCVPSERSITSKYYMAARHCQGKIEQSTPTDFYNISSIICGDQGSIKTLDDFKNNANEAASVHGWSVYLLHGIDPDDGYSAVPAEILRETLDFFNTHRNQFWVATFADAVRYIRERDAANIEEIYSSSDSILVQVSDSLHNDIYHLPISIARVLPTGWQNAQAYQNGKKIDLIFKKMDGLTYLVFDAVPDAGTVSLISTDGPKVSENKLQYESLDPKSELFEAKSHQNFSF